MFVFVFSKLEKKGLPPGGTKKKLRRVFEQFVLAGCRRRFAEDVVFFSLDFFSSVCSSARAATVIIAQWPRSIRKETRSENLSVHSVKTASVKTIEDFS